MSLELIAKSIKDTNFEKEWKNKKELLGNISIDFQNNKVHCYLDPKAGWCKGVYLISDGMSEKISGLYNGVSAKKTSTCRGRVQSHIRAIKKAMNGITDKNESSGIKFVNHFKSKNVCFTNLIVEYIDLNTEVPGLAGLVEENLIKVTEGPLNRENENNVENI